jgi:hypothetical protein
VAYSSFGFLAWSFVPLTGQPYFSRTARRDGTEKPTIVVSGKEGDPRIQLVREAVDFWNKQLSDLGSGFRLGPVTFTKETIPTEELAARSDAVLTKEGALKPTASLMKIDGDLIVALSDGDFVSFTGPFLSDGRRLVGIRGYHLRPLTLPNVARNVIAHELGHAIGLGHNDDPANLMCGRPASLVVPTRFAPMWSATSL